ncbi:PAP2 superfamily protein [Vibrio quintilis]|uniref:PAP2 superfamily protein n=1 Tax=Vibrio quintilis TaxID=1117707 RepID=A0A1M7YWU6_9VIBR|nr:PAP2 superfamily protein [Vibrio quintilis]
MNILKYIFYTGLLFFPFMVQAEITPAEWRDFSDIGADTLVGSALVLPVLEGDLVGFQHAGLSILAATAIVGTTKALVKAERPDKSDHDSFPSNHTANAFAAATNLHIRYGWQVGVPAYTVAALVGNGRVEGNKHHWEDVAVGAAVGIWSGWYFTSKNVYLFSWADRHEIGVVASLNW